MESLKILAKALECGDVKQAIAFLGQCQATPIDFNQENINAQYNDLILTGIKNCNEGNYQEVFVFLNNLGRRFGFNLQLTIEIFCLSLRKNIDLHYLKRFIETVSPYNKEVPVVRMLMAETCRRVSDFQGALELYNTLPAQEGWWPHDEFWISLSRGLSCYLMQVSAAFLSRQTPNHWKMTVYGDSQYVISDMMAGLIKARDENLETFSNRIGEIFSSCRIDGVDVGSQLITFLTKHITDLEPAQAALVFHLIVTYDKVNEVKSVLSKKDSVLTIWAKEPVFIKALDIFRQNHTEFSRDFNEIIDIFLSSPSVVDFENGNLAAFVLPDGTDNTLYAMEIMGRYRNKKGGLYVKGIPFLKRQESILFPKSGGEQHIFVGVFGQLRNPAENLKIIFDYLEKDSRKAREEGSLISIGFSTWDLSGSKAVSNQDRLADFAHRLPHKIENIFAKLQRPSLESLQPIMPQTCQEIIKLSQYKENITKESLKNYASGYSFENNVYANISSESQFMAELGTEFSVYFGEAHVGALLNQARMWHRISGLRDVISQAVANQNKPVGKIILIRPDVEFTQGSIFDLCSGVADQRDGRLVVCDEDGAAQWIHGVGDRYFVGHAQAVARLFDAQELILQIIRDPMLSKIYRSSLLYHRFARTIMYDSDYDLSWSSELKLQFIRQQMSWPRIKETLIKDCFNLQDENLVNIIQSEIKD